MITLAAESLTKSFIYNTHIRTILCNITVTFAHNKTYAITGKSGVGKSTLLYLLAGLETPSSGRVMYCNQNIADFSSDQKNRWLNQTIGCIFQYPYLIKELSVLENIMLPAYLYRSDSTQIVQRAQSLLQEVGLTHAALFSPYMLSGGEQQRVAIARALINNPQFILADEPTGNLDEMTGRMIVDLLLQCQKERGAGLLISSHDKYVAELMEINYEMKDSSLCLQ